MNETLAKAVTHREFLKMIGLAVVGAGAGQVVVPPQPVSAETFSTLTVTGNTYLATASGSVGIGTASPGSTLHVYSTANPTIARIHSGGGFGAGRVEFWSDPQGGGNEWRPGYIQSTDNGGFTGGLAFLVNGSGWEARLWSVEVMRLVNGNLGVGTTSPRTRTEMVKTYTLNQDPNGTDHTVFGVYSEDMTLLVTANNGRVQDKGGSIGFCHQGGFVLGAIKAAPTNSNGGEYGGYLAFHTTGWNSGGPYEKMRITQSGDIGIGTTSPQEKLHLEGGAFRIGARKVADDSGCYYA